MRIKNRTLFRQLKLFILPMRVFRFGRKRFPTVCLITQRRVVQTQAVCTAGFVRQGASLLSIVDWLYINKICLKIASSRFRFFDMLISENRYSVSRFRILVILWQCLQSNRSKSLLKITGLIFFITLSTGADFQKRSNGNRITNVRYAKPAENIHPQKYCTMSSI